MIAAFPDLQKLFKNFRNREKLLRAVTRYANKPVMYYRTNLWTHGQRVAWLIHSLWPEVQRVFKSSVQVEKLVMLAFVHDDHEVIMGDIPAAHKLKMNAHQRLELHRTEVSAINAISRAFPKTVGKYSYRALLMEMHTLKTLESRLVKFVDWLEGWNEALHEIYGGNSTFTQREFNPPYGWIPAPSGYYLPRLRSYPARYPELRPLFRLDNPFFHNHRESNFSKIARRRKPHTATELLKATDHPVYNHWKKIVHQYASAEEWRNLYRQKEGK